MRKARRRSARLNSDETRPLSSFFSFILSFASHMTNSTHLSLFWVFLFFALGYSGPLAGFIDGIHAYITYIHTYW